MKLLEAMAHMEGFFQTGSRPQRNNNPLDLIWGPEASKFGAIQGDPRFAVFPDIKTGWIAAQRWLSVPAGFDSNHQLIHGYLGATLFKVIYRFAPPQENNVDVYVNFVCQKTGYTTTTLVTEDMLEIPDEPETSE